MRKHADVISTTKADVLRLGSGIILIKLVPNCIIEKKDVKRFLVAASKLSAKNNFVLILDGNATLRVNNDAIAYISRKKEGLKGLAIVIRATSGNLYAKYFMKFANVGFPVKTFYSIQNASKWLKKFL